MNIKGADRNDTISYSQVIFNPHPANNGTHFFVEVVTVTGNNLRIKDQTLHISTATAAVDNARPIPDSWKVTNVLDLVPLLLIEIVFCCNLSDEAMAKKAWTLGIASGLMIAFGTAIFWWSSRVTAGAIGFVSGNRNFASNRARHLSR